MSEISMNENNFIGYEYKDAVVKREYENLYADSYPNFGWTLDTTTSASQGLTHATLKFKRDRKIANKAELTRLQRQFESLTGEIETLEKSKSSGAATAAYIIAGVGTAFMAGSVFAIVADMWGMGIILAIPAFIGWIVPYFCFTRIRKKKTDKAAPLIDQKFDAMYEVCEKGSALLKQC